jgi:long-subunit acyl-CoA synthetase (AMP-forming)
MRQTFGRVVDELNATRARFEAIRRFAIVESFDADDVEKTPTGKLKRAAIAEGRAEIIDALYAQD